jgi:hypothetical protein
MIYYIHIGLYNEFIGCLAYITWHGKMIMNDVELSILTYFKALIQHVRTKAMKDQETLRDKT